MIANITIKNEVYSIDLNQPIDLSLVIESNENNPIAWYLNAPKIEPVRVENWIGSVAKGASTNFNNIFFNPHGHGTHTECLGHITKDFYSINNCLKKFFSTALLVSISPEKIDNDWVITQKQIEKAIENKDFESLIIRTLPNDEVKKQKNYSHTNPPYLEEEAVHLIRNKNIQHLLVDLPSVDKEQDQGKLLSHKAFWNVKDVNHLNPEARKDATITELIYVPNNIEDGIYILNLMIASFENDAAPSKPILYKIWQ
ncbi:MAG: cyclase family protein [Flavobacterium sp.]